jgi:hypothetical protein
MCAGVEERAQPRGRQRDRVGPRDANDIEALPANESCQRRLERRRVQKSRLA